MAIAAALEYRDSSLRSERDIWTFTKLPTLATISFLDALSHTRTKSKGWAIFRRTAKLAEGDN
jgi:hypothetical protein